MSQRAKTIIRFGSYFVLVLMVIFVAATLFIYTLPMTTDATLSVKDPGGFKLQLDSTEAYSNPLHIPMIYVFSFIRTVCEVGILYYVYRFLNHLLEPTINLEKQRLMMRRVIWLLIIYSVVPVSLYLYTINLNALVIALVVYALSKLFEQLMLKINQEELSLMDESL